jgi:hypothetical protein
MFMSGLHVSLAAFQKQERSVVVPALATGERVRFREQAIQSPPERREV